MKLSVLAKHMPQNLLRGIVATKPEPVNWRIDVISGDGKYCFGNAVVVITRGFGYLIQVIHQLGVLGDDSRSNWISYGLCRIEEYIRITSPFESDENVNDS